MDVNNLLLLIHLQKNLTERLQLFLPGFRNVRIIPQTLLFLPNANAGIINREDITDRIIHQTVDLGNVTFLQFLPVFQILGTDYEDCHMTSLFGKDGNDIFTKMDFRYKNSVASIKVGDGVKSEGELVVSGTKGYIYVPAPWWKTDYFEVRYEDPADKRRYFYQLDGEGIRYELVSFVKSIEKGKTIKCIEPVVTQQITEVMENFNKRRNMDVLS